MKSVASHSSFLDLCQQHFLQVTVKTQKKHKHNIISSPAHTPHFQQKWQLLRMVHVFPRALPEKSLQLWFKSVFWSFEKSGPTSHNGERGNLANAPHSFFRDPSLLQNLWTHKNKKAQTSKQIFFRALRHHKKELQLENLPPLYDLASVGPYLLFFAP